MLEVRKWAMFVEEIRREMGRGDNGPPLRKVAACAVMRNPHAGRYVADLSDLVASSAGLCEELARRAAAALAPDLIESYGKAALVGTAGD